MKIHNGSIRLFFAAAALLFLSACATQRPTSPQTMRLYVFNCGSIETTDVSAFHPGIGSGERKLLTNSCYLVIHPKGSLMWDAGLPDALVHIPEGKTMYKIFNFRVTKTLVSQFKEIGYAPEAVGYLGISHMHGDHNGNANLFPRATLLMQKEEYAAAFGPDPSKYGFDPAGYPSAQIW